MTSPDPLSTLQQAIKDRSTITYSTSSSSSDKTASLSNASHVVFANSVAIPKTIPTRFRKPGSSTSTVVNEADFYSLEALYLAWLLRDAPGGDYMRLARDHGLAAGLVAVTERKKVVDWLEGKGGIDESRILHALSGEDGTPPGSPQRTAAGLPASTSQKARTAATSAGAETASPAKRRYVPDSADLEVVKRIKESEIELKDRITVLRGVKPNNFASVRTAWSDKLKKLKEASRSSSGAAQSSGPSTDNKHLVRKPKNNYPIIIISSSPSSLITMHNVKRFLQESVFEPSQDAKARSAAEGNSKPEDMIPLYRKKTVIDSSGKEIETHSRYFVVDSVEALGKFGPDCWDRVVCVMTTGQQWQFRPYKWSEPRILFHHVKGIYVSWTHDPPNPKIKDWNVTELKIDPHRRHVDKMIVASFWKTLDTWIQSNKPWLMT
ncbi:hypothetical protein D9611_004398 [Ephemerocybe angulata]|uniref:RNA polymerase II accessory factor n=2 Tax=Ephemerocybe angulata TaxID=980116 RepID=A0A8H6II73_9AGAR|nr:hypothetical protein D9611_004398 [Tulosesus angulatus]KAF6764903.1 RNA polymerase II accessory factor [Tulosesus angulatus]